MLIKPTDKSNTTPTVAATLPTRNDSLDAIKCIAAFLVVFIHTVVVHQDFSGYIEGYIKAFGRIAVPLFFMITGYYYPVMLKQKQLKGHIKKLVIWTLGSTFFFILLTILLKPFPEYLIARLNYPSLKNWLLFNEVVPAGHLWYFYAVLYVFFILSVSNKLSIKLYPVIPLLFIANYLLSYGSHLEYYRNFLLLGLPYVLLGCLFRNPKVELFYKSCSPTFLKKVFGGLCVALGAEMIIYLLGGYRLARDHYLCTLPITVCVFTLALQQPHWGKGLWFAKIGRLYSSYIYVLHPCLISVIHPLSWKFSSYTYPFIIFGLTLVVSMAVRYGSYRIKSFLKR